MASQSLQDPYLNALRKDRTPVSIFLMNGIKLQGQIDTSQMIYKHAVSTIVPSQPVKIHRDEAPATEEPAATTETAE